MSNDFNKTLTQEQIDAKSYLEWDDTTLGRFVKHLAGKLKDKDPEGKRSTFGMTAAQVLVSIACEIDAEELTVEISGLTISGQQKGNWIVTAKYSGQAIDAKTLNQQQ